MNILNKLNKFFYSLGDYFGSKSNVSTASVKFQNILYIAIFSITRLEGFIILVTILEALNYIVWYKKIRNNQLDKDLAEAIGD